MVFDFDHSGYLGRSLEQVKRRLGRFDQADDFAFAVQHIVQDGLELGPFRIGHDQFRPAPMRDTKDVENAAVAGGKNPRVENIEAKRGQDAGDGGEQAGPILGADGHRATVTFGEMLDIEQRAFTAKLLHQSKVLGNFRLGGGEKIPVGHGIDKIVDLGLGLRQLEQLAPDAALDAL